MKPHEEIENAEQNSFAQPPAGEWGHEDSPYPRAEPEECLTVSHSSLRPVADLALAVCFSATVFFQMFAARADAGVVVWTSQVVMYLACIVLAAYLHRKSIGHWWHTLPLAAWAGTLTLCLAVRPSEGHTSSGIFGAFFLITIVPTAFIYWCLSRKLTTAQRSMVVEPGIYDLYGSIRAKWAGTFVKISGLAPFGLLCLYASDRISLEVFVMIVAATCGYLLIEPDVTYLDRDQFRVLAPIVVTLLMLMILVISLIVSVWSIPHASVVFILAVMLVAAGFSCLKVIVRAKASEIK